MNEALIMQVNTAQQQMPTEQIAAVIEDLSARITEVRSVRERLVPGGGSEGHTSTALRHLDAAQQQLHNVMGMIESARQELANAEAAVRTAG